MNQEEVLYGKLVVIRRFEQSDITTDYVSWLNDPDVVKYSNQRFINHTYASCKSYFDSFAGTPNFFLKVLNIEDLSIVGTMTVYIAPAHATADVGIMLGRKGIWGKGFGQDAWDTVLVWLLANPSIRKVTAGTMRQNLAMIRTMERSGMVLEAIRPKQEVFNGIPEDLCYYGKYR